MPLLTYYVVQSFQTVDGAVVALEPKAAPGAASARALAELLAITHVGVIAWSKTGKPDLGEWNSPEIIFQTGTIPPEFEPVGLSNAEPASDHSAGTNG
jgi:hypothetical protein